MSKIKKTIVVVLAFGLLTSGVKMGNETISQAKAVKKPSVVKKATVMEGQVKSLVIKASGFKIKSIAVKSSDKSVLKVKAKKKTKSIVLTGVKTGFAKVTTTVTVLRNKKKKKYKLTTSVTVKDIAMSGYENIDVDYDVNTGKVIMNASVKMGLALIDMFVPGGKVISKGLDSVYSDLTKGGSGSGDSKELEEIKNQLDTISKDIESLRSEIDTQFSSLKGQIDKGFDDIEKKIVSQSIMSNDGELFDKLNTSIDATISQINTILNDETINDETKTVYIADLIGKNSQWTSDDNNLVFLFKRCMNSLSSASFKNQDANTDLYDIVYQGTLDRVKSNVMFSGEVKDISDKYIQKLTLLGLKAYAVASFCLKAHQIVSNISEDKVAQTAKEKFRSIQTLPSIVDSEIVTISKKMFDTELKDSVATHLNDYVNISRTTFLNKGKCSLTFKKNLKTASVKYGSNYFQNWTWTEGEKFRATCWDMVHGAGFNAQWTTYWPYDDYEMLTILEAEDLANHMRANGLVLGEYLKEVGFDLSEIEEGTLFLTYFYDRKGFFLKARGIDLNQRCTKGYDDNISWNPQEYLISWDTGQIGGPADLELKFCMFELDK